MNQKRNRIVRRAFTLLEVLMVIVIIGILAAIVVPQFFGADKGARQDLTKAAVKTGFNGALDLYRMHMTHYPLSSENGLMALVEQPDDEEAQAKWRGPYIKNAADLKDAWGHDYEYECPGQYNEDSFDLSSPGPDGQAGTDDDINNWKDA
ncbi:MAG: type II secretion system major pseudopilin GspG [Phycisphaerales bacterium]|nr:type II secretion system major pseudopilin GspG [Phycisphaerales bacterium]